VENFKVLKKKDFSEEGFIDEDEELLPKQNFIQIFLDNEFSIAIRPSGTEPKIKYYLFGCSEPKSTDLGATKKAVSETLETIGAWLVEDAQQRAGKK
jgi:phosphoglucomutase